MLFWEAMFPCSSESNVDAWHSSYSLLKTGLNRYLHGAWVGSCLARAARRHALDQKCYMHDFLHLPKPRRDVSGESPPQLDAVVFSFEVFFTGWERSNYLFKRNAPNKSCFTSGLTEASCADTETETEGGRTQKITTCTDHNTQPQPDSCSSQTHMSTSSSLFLHSLTFILHHGLDTRCLHETEACADQTRTRTALVLY